MKKVLSITLCIVLVLSVFAVMPLTVSAVTLSEVETFNGHSYELYKGLTTWKEAKAICEEQGGYLAVINSAEENSFLSGMMSTSYVWVGGSDEGSEGSWYWVNGNEFTYTNWNEGEPNNSAEIEHYLELTKSGMWNDLSNNDSSILGFICEYDSIKDPEMIKTTEYNNHKYEFCSLKKSWKEAKEYCEKKGGYLAVINSAEENEFLAEFAKNTYDYWWIGGSDEGSEGNWYWVNGDEFSYTNWNEGEPNNSSEIEHYLEFVTRNDKEFGKWNDLSNDHYTVNGFICEYDPSYILGDADDDGEVGVIDATYIQRYNAGFNIPISDEDIFARGDVDGDEEVSVIDATYIQRYDAGFNVPYPIGEAIA